MEVEGSVEYCGSLARPFSVKKKELFPLIWDNFSIERIYEKRNLHDILFSNAYEYKSSHKYFAAKIIIVWLIFQIKKDLQGTV